MSIICLHNRNWPNSDFKCIQITKTDFLVSKTDFKVDIFRLQNIFGKLDVMFTNGLPTYFRCVCLQIQSSCNGALKDEKTVETSGYAHLHGVCLSRKYFKYSSISVPENCEVSSKYFTIKKIAQFSPVEEASLALNKIYKIEETGIVMKTSGGHHQHLMTLKIPDRALIQQIKKHRDNLENKLNTIKISG